MKMTFSIWCLGAFLAGSIPFGLLLMRLAGKGDVRTQGSGNIGATNVMRAGGKGLGIATLLLDAAKGFLPVCLARLAGLGPEALAWVVLAAVAGHVFTPWLKFKGGKGVATFLGGLIGAAWPAALVFAFVWLAVAAISRYSSAAALAASLAAPISALWLADAHVAFVFGLLAALLWIKHSANIQRLKLGTESRIGGKA